MAVFVPIMHIPVAESLYLTAAVMVQLVSTLWKASVRLCHYNVLIRIYHALEQDLLLTDARA